MAELWRRFGATVLCAACGAFGLAGCSSSNDAASSSAGARSSRAAASAKPPASTTVIHYGDDGRASVSGAKSMKGDAQTCATFKRCCASRDLSLFCGMTEASEIDCDKGLRSVKQYAREAHVKLPNGC